MKKHSPRTYKNRFKWFRRSFKAMAIFLILNVVKATDLPEEALGVISDQKCTMEIGIQGGIGPASLDILERGQKRAEKMNCGSILLIINTPGGNLQSTRLIVENILNSPLPVLCIVAPSGAHAGSAGAIIMQACHVSGALEATNLGAATPISGGGEQMGEDMRNKIMNDTRSWVEGLAKLRGRNEEFAKDIVESAKAVSAREAHEIGAIDWVGTRKIDFLAFADGREVKMAEDRKEVVKTGDVFTFQPDLRYQFLSFFTNPQIAYLIFMGSLGLLYFELTNPGMMVPGVIGGVGLIISLVSLHMLDVTWAGLLLILLGMALMVAEAFVASFGILGIGGVTAFVIGSIFLFDTEATGYALPLSTIIPAAIFLALMMVGVAYLAINSFKYKKQGAFDSLVDHEGVVLNVDESGQAGTMMIQGELWKFASTKSVQPKEKVIVKKHKGFTLNVEPTNKA